jgi:hypothetical protein
MREDRENRKKSTTPVRAAEHGTHEASETLKKLRF